MDTTDSPKMHEEDRPVISFLQDSHALPYPKSDWDMLKLADDEECDVLSQTILKQQSAWLMRYHGFRDRIEEHVKLAGVPVKWKNKDHEKDLFAMWKVLRPDDPLPQQKDKNWGKLGFQGKDPVTDFRGMGVLAVQMFLYLGRVKPQLAKYIFLRHRQEDQFYPLACSCINLLSLCLDLLNYRKAAKIQEWSKQSELFRVMCSPDTVEESETSKTDPLFELVGCLMLKLDTTWVATESTYMDYPKLLAKMKERMILHLKDEVVSLEELFHRIQGDMELVEYKASEEKTG